jgi:hypothetical protein
VIALQTVRVHFFGLAGNLWDAWLELVARLEHDGHDTAQAIPLLEQFEEVLAIRVAYRDRLRKELGL